ncbi:MAG: C10 family peptidase [Lentimicrobiaceae bacterium]|nr:C10 family peptidase [Lentimicrobiaceae bacterium]
MKSYLLYFMMLIIAPGLRAQQLTGTQAAHLASAFYQQRLMIHAETASYPTVNHLVEVEAEGRVVAFAVTFRQGGFVLVSASDATLPVLGYSLKGAFNAERMPDALMTWLKYYGRQLDYANNHAIEPWIETQRELLINSQRTPGEWRYIEPLLRTQWDQGKPYNAQCPPHPDGPGGRCYAGCVATAVGQLMFYHRWPESGNGSYAYTHPEFGIISADFGNASYEWNKMETALQYKNAEIAELLFHLGVSFDMDYGPNGSGMWNHSAASSMRNFFKYGAETQYVFRDETQLDWDSILIANLDVRKPLYYAGWDAVGSENGHAFVCDGYDPDGFYHFNWGWSGQNDGYFLLTALNPGGSNFNFAQELIRDIYPDTTLYVYPEFCQEPDTLSGLRGTFSDGSNMVNYQSNADCFWLLNPDPLIYDSVTQLRLSFPVFDMHPTDDIVIYQGADTTAPEIFSYNGSNFPELVTVDGRNALVRFTSDASETANGFLISYDAILPVYCSGTSVYTNLNGTFDDGSGNKNYVSNTFCKYKINPSVPEPLILEFDEFNTETGKDILNVYDLGTQQLLASLSGDSVPGPLYIHSGRAMLVFATDDDVVASGWKIRWKPQGTIDANPGSIESPFVGPNPAGDWLTVKFKQGADFSLYTLTGKCLISHSLKSSSGAGNQINLAKLEPGLYIVTLQSAEKRYVYKVVKL